MARDTPPLLRGTITRVPTEADPEGVFVEVAEIAVGFELGPCQALVPITSFNVGQRVLVASIGVREDVVILGRLYG